MRRERPHPLRVRPQAPSPAVRERGDCAGLADVPDRHRCRRHLHRPRRGRRWRRDDARQGALDARRTRRSACWTGSSGWPKRLGLDRAALLAQTERIVHGTTVATNALLERKGARVGLLTTEGHRDVIEMREGLKDDRYNLRMPPPEQLVPRRLRLGVRERMRADGRIEIPLDPASLDARDRRAADRNRSRRSRSATCTPGATRATSARPREALQRALPDAYVSLSSEVLPQIKEFERVSTTVVNAYVGPVLSRYLARLEAPARRGRLSGADPDHPVAWRRRADRRGRAAGGRRRAVGTGRRRRRQRLRRAPARAPEPDPVRHGRHLDRHLPGRRTARRRWS